MKIWAPVIVALCIASAVPAVPESDPIPDPIFSLNGRIPLGVESFRLKPSGKFFYVMASVENPGFDGLYRENDKNGHLILFGRNDTAVKFYPARLQFRITASSREKLLADHSYDVHSKLAVNDLLGRLRFRLKVFDGLDYRYIHPVLVEDVGMPTQIDYDERIYRIGFEIGKIPVEDRMVIEVLSPNGDRLCKFHLDLL